MSQHCLDVRRLLCPLPVIRVSERVKLLNPGDTLEVTATDPGVLYDIPAWCKLHGFLVTETQQTKYEIRIVIAKPDIDSKI